MKMTVNGDHLVAIDAGIADAEGHDLVFQRCSRRPRHWYPDSGTEEWARP